MDRCPHCGVQLAPLLVAAIRNPDMPESCPKLGKRRAAAAELRPSLETYMLTAAILRKELLG